MLIKKISLVAAVMALAVSPTVGYAQQNADRAAVSAEAESDLSGSNGSAGIILALLAAAAVIAGIVIAAGGDKDTAISA